MSGWRVEKVGDKRTWDDFLRLPYEIYEGDRNWVPPLEEEMRRTLDPKINPYFASARLALLVCSRDDRPVARACVVVNPEHWRRFGEKAAFFGFFESADDDDAAGRLLDAAARFGRDEGAETIEGPFNPNHYSELGLQTSDYERPPAFFEAYNPPYYVRLMERNGFRSIRQLHTRANPDVGGYIRRRYGAIARPVRRGRLSVRAFRLFDMKAELERIRTVFNDAFADNWHFLPLTPEEYSFAAKYLFLVTYPRLVVLAEEDGEAVGVAQCALDINPLLRQFRGRASPTGYARFLLERRRIRDVVFYAVGIRSRRRGTAVYRILLDYLCWALRGSRVLTTTWMTDDNVPALAAAGRLGLQPVKRFAIYARRVEV